MIAFALGFILGVVFVLVGLGLWIAHGIDKIGRKL